MLLVRSRSTTLALLCSLGALHCSAEDPGAVESTSEALSTPTGADWIVLPRPPARTTRIFDDAYVAPFVWEGWSSTATPDAAVKTEGTTSLAVNLQTAWSAFGAGVAWAEAPYSGAAATEVSFAFNAGATVHAGIATLAVGMDDDDAATPVTYLPLKPLLSAGVVAANTWYRVRIPMSALNPGGLPMRRLLIANRGTLGNVTFSLDDVRMSWTDAVPITRAIYTDAAGADFAVGGWSETNTADPFRTGGAVANKASFTGSYGALTFAYDWNKPELAKSAYTNLAFDISAGPGVPAAALATLKVGLDYAPSKNVAAYIPGGFQQNTWHTVTIPLSELSSSATFRLALFKNESTSKFPVYVDNVRLETDHAAPPVRVATPPVGGEPDTFAAGEVDVVSVIKTADERKPISPWIYGINGTNAAPAPSDVMSCFTYVRRGGDRSNTLNWENNLSNGSRNNGFVSDAYLAQGLANPSAPGELDRTLIATDRAAGRGTLVPFVLNDYVVRRVGANIPYTQPGWDKHYWFDKVELVKPAAAGALTLTPDLDDGFAYTDEHLYFLQQSLGGADIYAPGPTQVFVGTDNEPDLYGENYPMLQEGSGETLYYNGAAVGTLMTGNDFTTRFLTFAKRVKQLSPSAAIVGPGHYAFDGWTSWRATMIPPYGNGANSKWQMEDFLAAVKTESQSVGQRLLETWDMHWYPQRVFNGVYTHYLDDSTRSMSAAEVDAVLQGPRSYWDAEYDEQSWITRDHLHAPANMLNRLQTRIDANYPGTKLGVTEYFPGGRGHIASGLATVDSLGVFGRMGVGMAAMWAHPGQVQYAFGGVKLLRNASGTGVRFGDTSVKVEHPEKAQSSVYAASDVADVVTVLVVNKTNAVRRFGVRAFHAAQLGRVDAYRIDAAHANPTLAFQDTLSKNNAYAYAAPAWSATLLVFRTN